MKIPNYLLLGLVMTGMLCQSAMAADYSKSDDFLARAVQQAGYGGAEALTGMAASQASAGMESWLDQYGNARVNLGMDSHFGWENSAVDMLLPVYNSPDNLIFTQYGVRRKDARTTGNLGFGLRHFFSDWMLGYNTFFDDDITGHNQRWGIGAEVWRDDFRISANGYFPVSNWHTSDKLNGYDERPARGEDIRVDGYLPSMPSVGGKLMYEQYFGDEVALFGQHMRQKDPYAVTMGINYSPVPMVTVGMDYRSGKSGRHETQLLASLNYRLGIPLSKQLDSNQVGELRSLSENRLDLVARNNAIVMNYRKQEEVKLQLPSTLEGKVNTDMQFTAHASSRYPITRIRWSDSDFIAAGGKLIKLDNQAHYRLTLPARAGTWIIQGQAIDSHGRLSNTATMQIISTPGVKPIPSPAVISHLHMVREGSAIFGEGFGDLIYGAQIDADHIGTVISWSLTFNAWRGRGEASLPVHVSGTATSTSSGEVQIRIPMSRLPLDKISESNLANASDFSLSATPDGGETATTHEGGITLQPIQGKRLDFHLDKNELSLHPGGKERIKATVRNSRGDHEPVKDLSPYITTNCRECSLEYGKTDDHGDIAVTLSAGNTPGNYEVIFAAASDLNYNKITIPLLIN